MAAFQILQNWTARILTLVGITLATRSAAFIFDAFSVRQVDGQIRLRFQIDEQDNEELPQFVEIPIFEDEEAGY
jgi:hypothetical protein